MKALLSRKQSTLFSAGEDVGNVNSFSHAGSQYRGLSKNLKQNYHKMMLFHFWAYIGRNKNQHTIETSAHPCLSKDWSQQIGYEISIHQLMNG
jgi:hypothetical protein